MRLALTPREAAVIGAAHLAANNPMSTWQPVGHSGLLFDVDGSKVCLRRGSKNTDFSTPQNYRVELWRFQWLNWALAKIKASKQRGDRRHGGIITHAQKEVLRALVSFVDPKRLGVIDPSYAALAGRAKTARSTAQLAVAHSVVFGLIKKVRRYVHWDTGHGIVAVQDTNAYVLVVPKELQGILHDTESRSVVASPSLKTIKPQAPCQNLIHNDLAETLLSLGKAIEERNRHPLK